MANIRPNQLPPATEITNNDRLILDQGAAGVNAAPPKSVLDAFAPIATQSEAESGQDNEKRMTPLRAQQHLLAQGVPNTRSVIAGEGLTGGGTLESDRTVALSSSSIASLELADSAVQPSREINAGEGLAGGGDLTDNRSISLSVASIASLAKADTALQAPGGVAGQVLAKSSNADNDVGWVSSEAATAVSYGPQYLNPGQQDQARQNISALAEENYQKPLLAAYSGKDIIGLSQIVLDIPNEYVGAEVEVRGLRTQSGSGIYSLRCGPSGSPLVTSYRIRLWNQYGENPFEASMQASVDAGQISSFTEVPSSMFRAMINFGSDLNGWHCLASAMGWTNGGGFSKTERSIWSNTLGEMRRLAIVSTVPFGEAYETSIRIYGVR